jgi:hypothetical protein
VILPLLFQLGDFTCLFKLKIEFALTLEGPNGVNSIVKKDIPIADLPLHFKDLCIFTPCFDLNNLEKY